MADLTTGQIFVNGEKNITHTKLNNIIGLANVSSDIIALKPGAIASVASYLLMYDGTTQLKKVNVGNLINVANLGTGANGFGLFASQSGNTYNFYRIKGDPATLTVTQEGNDLLLTVIASSGIADNSVTTPKIVNGAVTLAKMATGSVDAPQLVANAVTSAAIAANAVTNAAIATGAVTSASILDGTIVSADLAMGAVAAVNIAAGAVGNAAIATNSVQFPQIASDTQNSFDSRNVIRNGDFRIWQRGTSLAAVADAAYTADGWINHTSGLQAVTVSQQTVNLAYSPGNNLFSRFCIRYATTSANASPAATNALFMDQAVEGNLAEPLFGVPTSVSFWVRASKTGAFTCVLRDGAASVNYKHLFTISAANTWQKFSIAGATAFPDGSIGTWNRGTGLYYRLGIVLMAGSTFTDSNADAWNAGNILALTGQSNFCSTTSDTFDVDLVQHEPGSTPTQFNALSLEQGVIKNQRYAYIPQVLRTIGTATTGTLAAAPITLPVSMRVAPSLSNAALTASTGAAGTPSLANSTTETCDINNSGTAWTVGARIFLNAGSILSAEL